MGGYRWKQIIVAARTDIKVQRKLLLEIAQGGLTAAELYQRTTAIVLLSAAIDERLVELSNYRDESEYSHERPTQP